jgi:hypothetical protein
MVSGSTAHARLSSRAFFGRGVGSAALVALTIAATLAATPAHASVSVNARQPVIVSPNPVDWTPNVLDGRVRAIAQVGSRMILGGTFTQVQNAGQATILTRTFILAFNASTGAVDTAFTPVLDGDVEALAPAADGRSVYVGGAFTTVNGAPARGFAELDTTTGQLVPGFKASADGRVYDIVLNGSRLFIAGGFSYVDGLPRANLAAVNPTTGALDPNVVIPFTTPRKGTAFIQKLDVSPDGSKLVALGNFTIVAGLDRYQIAMINLSTTPASVADWETDRYKPACSTSFVTYMRNVDFSPDGTYFVVVSTGAYFANTLCDTAARWESSAAGSALQPTWVDYTGGDTLYSVAVTGTAVYVGGHERWANNPLAADAAGPGAVPRPGIAALDPVNGMPFSWNPTKDRGVGTFALLATNSGLWETSDSTTVAGEYHARVAFFPADGGPTVPPAVAGSLPGLIYRFGLDGSASDRSYDGAAFGSPSALSGTGVDWSHDRGAFMLSGKVYTGWDDGTFAVRTFNGATFGAPATLNLYGLTSTYFTVSKLTGMFYDNGSLYYTIAGDSKMYSRYFEAEDAIVGGQAFVVSGSGDGLDWKNVIGMTMASGHIYYSLTDGTLYRINFSSRSPVPGTAVAVSGPSIDGIDWRSRGLFLLSSSDKNPPSTPGTPSGQSVGPSEIQLTWTASADDQATTLTYRIYRDGGGTPVGTVVSSSTDSVSFTDTGLAPGSAHTYQVDAGDGVNFSAKSNPSSTIQVAGGIVFTDGFDGGLAAWNTTVNVSLDSTTGATAPPSVLAGPSGVAAYAARNLGVSYPALCLTEAVNPSSVGSTVVLMRLRTAANGPVGRLFMTSGRALYVKSDVSGQQVGTGTSLPLGSWTTLKLCGTVGSSGTWDLYVNGAHVLGAWTSDNGNTQIGRVEIGSQSAGTFVMRLDDVLAEVP